MWEGHQTRHREVNKFVSEVSPSCLSAQVFLLTRDQQLFAGERAKRNQRLEQDIRTGRMRKPSTQQKI